MVGRCVECVEAMIIILDLGTVRDREADLAKRAYDVVGDLG